MSRVFLGVGSNEGDRFASISKAVQTLGTIAGIQVTQMAMIIETQPVGGPPQGPYLNTVVELETTLDPQALLGVLKDIEQRLGRRAVPQRWAPRPIDLDLLLYDDRVIQGPDVCVPHPRMHERRFVLEPLAQLAPALVHPVLKQPIHALLTSLLKDPMS